MRLGQDVSGLPPQTLREARGPQLQLGLLQDGGWEEGRRTSRSKVKGWRRERRRAQRGPRRSRPPRASWHYLIAARAHWLVPAEAGPMRRSPLTRYARSALAQPPASAAPRGFRRPRARRSRRGTAGAGWRPEVPVVRAQIGQPWLGSLPCYKLCDLGQPASPR